MKRIALSILALWGLLAVGCTEQVSTINGSVYKSFQPYIGSRIIDVRYWGSDEHYDYFGFVKYGMYRISKTHQEPGSVLFIEENERFPLGSPVDDAKRISFTLGLSRDIQKCWCAKFKGIGGKVYDPSARPAG